LFHQFTNYLFISNISIKCLAFDFIKKGYFLVSSRSVGIFDVQVGKNQSQVGIFEAQVGKIVVQVGIANNHPNVDKFSVDFTLP
jgi:hypothetical protein